MMHVKPRTFMLVDRPLAVGTNKMIGKVCYIFCTLTVISKHNVLT